MSTLKFQIGDYIRWETGVTIFSASAAGVVNPIEFRYDYGIVVDVAEGNPDVGMSDVIIAYSLNRKNWIVAHVDDSEYEMEIVSKAKTCTIAEGE